MVKTQLPTAPGGRFAKDRFRIDLAAGTVTCPARVTMAIRPARRGGGQARFGVACSVCPLRQVCTSSLGGRVVAVHPREAELAIARSRQRDPAWLADYRSTRPRVERKLAHLLRRRHGGRRARVRGLVRVAQDFRLLAAAVNLARYTSLLGNTATGISKAYRMLLALQLAKEGDIHIGGGGVLTGRMLTTRSVGQ